MDVSQTARFFKALANEHRLQIVQRLMKKALACRNLESCDLSDACCDVGELAASLDISLPTVSYHLKELRNVGLITTQRQGRYLYSSIHTELLEQAFASVCGVVPQPDREVSPVSAQAK